MNRVQWFCLVVGALALTNLNSVAADQPVPVPYFEVDAAWPSLPDGAILGEVSGISIDDADHIWILHRSDTLSAKERGATSSPPRSQCCTPLPPVVELSTDGQVLQAWGGPSSAPERFWINQWPFSEHGLFVDHKGHVWLTGNGRLDHMVLEYTADGKAVGQYGLKFRRGGDQSMHYLGRPADVWVDPATNITYVADGYGNHRVLGFDAATKDPKQVFGANGKRPGDPTVNGFGNPVHCVVGASDDRLYVCDRDKNRIQVFRKEADGSFAYDAEFPVGTGTGGGGAAWDVALSPDETYLYVADGENERIWILVRATGQVLTTLGSGGHQAGQFIWLHAIDVDSAGNIYTVEVNHGRRVQKFTFMGYR